MVLENSPLWVDRSETEHICQIQSTGCGSRKPQPVYLYVKFFDKDGERREEIMEWSNLRNDFLHLISTN